MKSENENKQNSLEKEYAEIMKGFALRESPAFEPVRWTNLNDPIQKFSLYNETPNSITSTDTVVYLGIQ